MKKTDLTMRLFSLVLVLVVVAAMAFALVSCGNTNESGADTSVEEKEEITITVKVKGSDGNVTDFLITTKAEFLGDALKQENLVQGDEGEFGLYVKVVNGETADYNENGAYWSFYKGDEYLMTGIDTTPIADGDVFRIEYTVG